MRQSLNLGLKVKIIEYFDDSQPGWVICTFADAYGVEWSIIDKVPILTDKYLDEKSDYPQEGIISCVVVSEKDDDIVKITTSRPTFIAAENGEHEFFIFKHQLTDYDNWTSKA